MKRHSSELDITCFHVGGYGDYSHINVIGQKYPRKTVFVVFEAREAEDDEVVQHEYEERGIRTILVQKCIAGHNGPISFNVNVNPASSSIFSMSEAVRFEHMPDQETLPMWVSHATTDKKIDVEATTIDDAICDYRLPHPDIVSIDAQGAEFSILKGGINAIKESTMAVITEVEFFPIYDKQPLFHHQFELLYQCGFRLGDILAMQYWHPTARIGRGMLTVGEALFLRFGADYLDSLSICRLIKYAAIAMAFNRLSLAVYAMNIGIKKFGPQILPILKENQEFSELLKLQHYILTHMDQYKTDAFFFEKDEMLRSQYGIFENLSNRSL